MARIPIILVLGLLSVLTVGQLTIDSSSYINFYQSASSSSQNYFNTGSSQIFSTENGFSIVYENQTTIFEISDSACVGTNTSELFCYQTSGSNLNSVNIPTGEQTLFASFEQTINSVQASFDSLLVSFDSDNDNLVVLTLPSQTPVCNMSVVESSSYSSVSYFNGQLMTTPYPYCTDSCNFYLFNCTGPTQFNITTAIYTNFTINITSEVLNDYSVQNFFFQSGENTQIVGFPYVSITLSTQYQGFIIFSNQTWTNSILTSYTQVWQLNLTNILVLTTNNELQQYEFNFTGLTFNQVGSSITIPSSSVISVSPFYNDDQVALVMINSLTPINFFINLNSMSIINSNTYPSLQITANGSNFAFLPFGYFIYSGNNIISVNDSSLALTPAIYLPYEFPASFPNVALALALGYDNSAQLFSQSLSGNNSSIFTNLGAKIDDDPAFVALCNCPDPIIVTSDSSYQFNVYTTEGLVLNQYYNPTGSPVMPMIFINNATNILYVYTSEYLTTYSTTNWSMINQVDISTLYGSFVKVTETLFLAWNVTNEGTYNSDFYFYAINPFNQSVLATYAMLNTSNEFATDLTVTPSLNSEGNIQALFVSTQSGGVSPSWIVYANNSTYSGSSSYYSGIVNNRNALYCGNYFSEQLYNCTQYTITDNNNNNGGNTSGGPNGNAGLVIAVVVLLLLFLVSGFLYRRNLRLKKSARSASTSGIAMAKV